jgi:hypothetical protein
VAQGDPRIELRAKLENTQETGSFKAGGVEPDVASPTSSAGSGVRVCTQRLDGDLVREER